MCAPAVAEETVDRAVKEYNLKPERGCITKDVQLVGSQGWTKLMFIKLIQVRRSPSGFFLLSGD